MSGLGVTSLGLHPAGFGFGDDAPEPPIGSWGSRYINPQTGDHELDESTGQLKQTAPVRQRFLLKLRELYGSSSVRPQDGVKLPRKIDPTLQREVDDAVRVVMRQETDVEKVARIDGVTVERDEQNSGRVAIVVSYVDLTTGLGDEVKI